MNLTGRNRVAPGDDNVLTQVSGTGLSRVMTLLAALLADSGHPSRRAAALVRLSLTCNPFPGATEQES
jgi:hypothetical protein